MNETDVEQAVQAEEHGQGLQGLVNHELSTASVKGAELPPQANDPQIRPSADIKNLASPYITGQPLNSTPSTTSTAQRTASREAYSSAAVDTQVQEIPAIQGFHVLKASILKPEPLPHPEQKPRCVYITLDPCGDKNQDVRRMRRIHDILISRPGKDRFAFRVCENGRKFEITFPNMTTGLTETLISKLKGMLGTHNIDITQLF